MARGVARILVTVGMCVASTLAATGQSSAEPRSDAPAEYVALGDSYVAGPGIPLQTGFPPGCARSDHNYPSLVRDSLQPEAFHDVSCSGATTKELTSAQHTRLGTNPAQLDALSEETDLVTLGIGGNDINFTEIVTTCAKLSSRDLAGAACKDHFRSDGTDELAERIKNTAPKVDAALADIKERAPNAQILLVGYPVILPDSGPGCYPLVPFSPGDVAWLRQTTKALNAMLEASAERADVEFVDTYRTSIGHDVCQLPGRKWVEGLIPTAPAAPVHPNALGMRNSADTVLASVRTGVLAGQ